MKMCDNFNQKFPTKAVPEGRGISEFYGKLGPQVGRFKLLEYCFITFG